MTAATASETLPEFHIGGRPVGPAHPPLVIAEIGINHEGDPDKAHRMVDDAADAGVECVKFQTHVVEDEMIPNDVVPGNADEPIYAMMRRCALSAEAERELKAHAEERGMIFLSTPFSRAAADRLAALDVAAYKIGSGECNNYPLVRHIAGLGKPVILSTGMNDVASVEPAVEILRAAGVGFALLHCTSVYPTPPELVRLGAMGQLAGAFPDAVLGLSDHTTSIYPCLGAVPLGASVLERHFTSDMSWPGPDIAVSSTPAEFAELVRGSRLIHAALGGTKEILPVEQPTIDFAYACVVTTAPVAAGAELTKDNTWVKRPGTGPIKAVDYERVLGRRATRDLAADRQVDWSDLTDG
ncbi:N-acetylneuraminate synthase family protein [Saccharothrix obliqua]|uniref:N-acetylneuraminate synthase family protein n=1 Tax=Saccharothrix obliqua TaxID=2861747 RepID=UPI001C5D4154|nr:N-acetylneuraminate synthase family protein [Saccharothrix obliqua]MBW4716780.1 N-acetylneuraminate synthase family protein [Saccharothrix obliqua]